MTGWLAVPLKPQTGKPGPRPPGRSPKRSAGGQRSRGGPPCRNPVGPAAASVPRATRCTWSRAADSLRACQLRPIPASAPESGDSRACCSWRSCRHCANRHELHPEHSFRPEGLQGRTHRLPPLRGEPAAEPRREARFPGLPRSPRPKPPSPRPAEAGQPKPTVPPRARCRPRGAAGPAGSRRGCLDPRVDTPSTVHRDPEGPCVRVPSVPGGIFRRRAGTRDTPKRAHNDSPASLGAFPPPGHCGPGIGPAPLEPEANLPLPPGASPTWSRSSAAEVASRHYSLTCATRGPRVLLQF